MIGIRRVFLLLLLSISTSLFGQVLINSSIDLNAGGKINDVEYNPYHDGYFVVGSFTEPNGAHPTSDNILFIDGDDFSINTATNLNPIVSMDGEIWSVEMTRTYNGFCDCYIYHLYIGGNFSTIETTSGTYNRNGIVKLTATHGASADPSTMTDFNISPWDADLGMITLWEDGVYDIDIIDDTLIFTGQFYEVNTSSSADTRDGFAAYNLVSGALLSYPALLPSGGLSRKITNYEVLSDGAYIALDKNYLSGNQGDIWKLDGSGNVDPSFDFEPSPLQVGYRMRELDDSLLFVLYDYNSITNGADNYIIVRKSDGSEKLDHEFSEDGLDAIGGVCCSRGSMDIYKNYLFLTTGDAGNSLISFEHEPGTGAVGSSNWNGSATNSLNPSHWGHLFIEQNVLFVSASNLGTLSGQSRQGLGLFCLEPGNPITFTEADSTVCPDQIVTYTVPSVDFAEGYIWSYSGTGADLNLTGAPENLVQIMPGPTGNSIDIEYTEIFTPGQLSVVAYSTCNDNLITSDTLFSKPLIANILSNPIPDADAGPDTSITCAVDSVLLIGTSTTSGVSYEWVNTGPYGNTLGTDTLTFEAGEFILKVISPLGCPNYDTVYVAMDTIKPDVLLPPGPYELTCSDTAKSLLGSTSISDSITYWKNVGSGAIFPNPISVTSPGNYRYIVEDISNGCLDSADLIMILNQPVPNIKILGYTTLSSTEPLDTITCYQDTLSLTCGSDTMGTVCNWTLADTSVLYGDFLDITSAGNYYILVEDTLTGCTNFTAVNIAEFTTPPDVLLPPPALINCSVDSVVLDGSSTISPVGLEWNGPGISGAINPLTAFDAGYYFLTVTRLDNGCFETDSLLVSMDNSINVLLPEDTLVCNNSPVDLNVLFEGDLSGVSYNWNNGESTSNATYNSGEDSIAIVEIFVDDGCYGTDTIQIMTPIEVEAEISAFQPCGDDNSGQLVIVPIQGIPPFQYSLDGGSTLQTEGTFTGLSIGDYEVIIFDSLNCEYSFYSSINQSSSLPEPDFLFSTYNFESDSVVLIDVSNPPADSVSWTIPPELIILDPNPNAVILLLPDTGTFSIGLNSYYGSCEVFTEKLLYASEFDSTSANTYNQNGIKSLSLYPNPNDGMFTVEVEFFKSQNAICVLQSTDGIVVEEVNYSNALEITEAYSLDLIWENGSYVFKVIGEFDSGAIVFILSR